MPGSWLNVPHFQQEFEYSRVAACARMVLAHYGDTRTETALRALLDTQATGIRAGNLMRLSDVTFEVYLRPSNVAELQKTLAANQPVIVFLQTGALAYWSMDIFHTAVLAGLDSSTAALHDPYLPAGPQTASFANFEKAWAQTGQFAAFIRPRAAAPIP